MGCCCSFPVRVLFDFSVRAVTLPSSYHVPSGVSLPSMAYSPRQSPEGMYSQAPPQRVGLVRVSPVAQMSGYEAGLAGSGSEGLYLCSGRHSARAV